jgi:hypothetical protein
MNTKRGKDYTADSPDPVLNYAANFPYLADIELVTDTLGKPKAVLLPLDSFGQLMRDYWALAAALKAKDEDMVDWEDALAELRADGILPPQG